MLTDIVRSIEDIDVHLGGRRVLEEFLGNITIRRAVEREVEIIGEATNGLLKLSPKTSITSARKIVDLRNRVIHAYDKVDETLLWKLVVVDIPFLKSEVQELLGQL